MRDFTFEDPEDGEHFKRIHDACFNSYDLHDVVRYIEEKTYLNGEKYSFKKHEYQKDIISDTYHTINVQKCAQVGMSEIMARYAAAICRVMPYFKVILTMPGAGDAGNFFKTRIDPMIADSPDLRNSLDPTLNNTEIKGIGTSLLYGRGTRGTTAALSVPADMLIHDEIDRSDAFTLAQYQSRLKHSAWKFTRKFGTPTIKEKGIALAMAQSKRLHHMCKCDHCNHQFVPNYHDHVHIPGFDLPKKEINAHNIMTLEWEKAVVLCPKCGKMPDLGPNFREWVCENDQDNFAEKGYYVTPFSVPYVVPTSRIVYESTKFTWSEFCNQTLGETSANAGESLMLEDVQACKWTQGGLLSGDLHAMGVDLGSTCYFTIGRLTQGGQLLVVHRERCSVADLRVKYRELKVKYRVLTSVFDMYPYTTEILELQKYDKNLYAARYTKGQDTDAFKIVTAEENIKAGELAVLLAKIGRDLHFDIIMNMYKNRQILWQSMGEIEDMLWEAQMLDMKRVLKPTTFGDAAYTWEKKIPDNDHYHHSLGYLNLAARLMPTATTTMNFSQVPIIHSLKLQNHQESGVIGSMSPGGIYLPGR